MGPLVTFSLDVSSLDELLTESVSDTSSCSLSPEEEQRYEQTHQTQTTYAPFQQNERFMNAEGVFVCIAPNPNSNPYIPWYSIFAGHKNVLIWTD